MTNDTPSISETDQLEAGLRDALDDNGLALIERIGLNERWLAEHPADELLDALLTTASAIGREGGLLTLVATTLPTGIGYVLCTVRRAEDGEGA